MSSIDWFPSKQYYCQDRKMFIKCINYEGIKLGLGFDHGLLQGIFTLDGQDITNVVCDDHFAAFEADIAAECEHE